MFAGIFIPVRFAPGAPYMRITFMAENGEEPRLEARPGRKAVLGAPGRCQGVLRYVFRNRAPAAQPPRQRAESGNEDDQFPFELSGRVDRRRHRRIATICSW